MDPQAAGGGGGDMPSAEELLEMLDSLTGLSEEDKESIRQSILSPINQQAPQQPYEDPGINVNVEFILSQIIFFGIIFFFVFFGYKLYRSLMDKERKKEDKKKLKAGQKKKK